MRVQIPILCFLSLPLLLLPLPWHLRARNIPTLTIITALFITNLVHAINSLVWSSNVIVKIPVWCDITTKLIIGVQVALPAASLCITKHLEFVASIRQTMQTADDKRRRQIFEFCMCGVLPCLIMILHTIVQGHRFDLLEDFGCNAAEYYSIPSIIILYVPPLLLSLISMVYAILAFVWFMKRRAQFAEHLRSSNSGLTSNRYIRLMAMAITEVVVGNGLGTWLMALEFSDSVLRPWTNWADVHSDFGRIAQFPRVLVPEYYWNRLLITWYIPIIGSVTFFAYLGLGQEAMGEYRKVYEWIRVHVFRLQPKPSNESILPTWSAPPAPTSRTARVRLDDLDIDMVSLDDKWEDKLDDSSIPASGDGDKSFMPSSPSQEALPPLPPLNSAPLPPRKSLDDRV